MDDKERRPSWERKAIRRIMEELDVKYTVALREYERRRESLDKPTDDNSHD